MPTADFTAPNGNIVYEEGVKFLEDLFTEHHADLLGETEVTINDACLKPQTVKQAVRLHIDDTPQPLGWLGTFSRFVENLPNFSRFATVFPKALRTEIVQLALNGSSTLHAALQNLGGAIAEPAPVASLETRVAHLRQQYERENTTNWPTFVRGVAQGLRWLASLEAQHETFAVWVHGRIGLQPKGAVDASQVWSLISEIRAERITWMGEAVTANFLKDAGIAQFAKPDVQTTNIIKNFASTASEGETFTAIIKLANEAGVWPRDMDRVLWLIGSGKFHYMPGGDKAVGGKSEARIAEFIKRLPAA